jgi:hypothetical protein
MNNKFSKYGDNETVLKSLGRVSARKKNCGMDPGTKMLNFLKTF